MGGNGKPDIANQSHYRYLINVTILKGVPLLCSFYEVNILDKDFLIPYLPVRMATCPQVSPWSGSSLKASASLTTSLGSIAKRFGFII